MEHFDDIFKKKLEHYDSGKPGHLWEPIQQELQRQTAPTVPHWIWTSVAVGALVVAGLAAYFLYQKTPHKTAPVSSTATVTLPSDALSDSQPAATEGMTSAAVESITAIPVSPRPARASATDLSSPAENAALSPGLQRFNWDWNPDIDAIVKAMEAREKALSDLTPSAVVVTPATTTVPDPSLESAAASVPEARQQESAPERPVVDVPRLNLRSEYLPSSAALHLGMCYSFERPCRKMYLEPYADATYSTLSLTAVDGESAGYRDARLHSEQPLWSPGIGARFSLISCRGLALRAGIQYQQRTFRFDYLDEDAIRNNTVNVLVDTIFTAPGDTLYIWDTLSIVQHGTLIKKTYNHFRSVDIPLFAGYEVETYRWVFSVNAGALIHIVSWQQGEILHPDMKPVSITTGETGSYEAYRTNMGISLTAHLGFYYKLPNHSQILIEPHFRYPLRPVSVEGYPLVERHFTGGLRVGLRLPIAR